MRASSYYGTFYKAIGKYNIYISEYDVADFKPSDEYNSLAIKIICRGEDSANRLILYASMCCLQWQLFLDRTNFTTEIECRTIKNKILNDTVTELMFEVNMYDDLSYDKIVQTLQSESEKLQLDTITGEILPDLSNAKISLSCAWKHGKYKYVTVRFAGYSVKYFFNKNGYNRQKTKNDLDDRWSDGMINKIMEILDRPEILERATTKDTNTSGIGVSSPIEMHLVKPTKEGWKFATSKEISDPSIEPAFVLDEGGKQFLVDGKRLYLINRITHIKDKDGYGYSNDHYIGSDPIEKGVSIKKNDVQPTKVDPFTKKRIERAIKRKL